MRKRVVITTPFPTAEDLAETYGISKTRMRKLNALADEILGRDRKKAKAAPALQTKHKQKVGARA
jgi:hypothetical protein